MNTKPILFNAEMVCAKLEGRKTQTRRPVDGPKRAYPDDHWSIINNELVSWPGDFAETEPLRCPYGKKGDLLWVKESYRTCSQCDSVKPSLLSRGEPILYEADQMVRTTGCVMIKPGKLRRLRFMPRWASRLTLEITNVRVERLQDISESDAEKEGIFRYKSGWTNGQLGPFSSPVLAFSDLWDSIYQNWDTNPWVWVIEFKVHHCNIDAFIAQREAA
ncbi:hypothetical protein [uncultured Gilvimarinus sp.]|uniref:hypothetical protein n=1 Tax=uncultured Gilvimarinus sp. TaxID=1689143 RepID=UPI0030EE9538|tara:strand:+ start:9377 stop:10030 length:654 start_codon:yes stop_codon:yes gene_type:complete